MKFKKSIITGLLALTLVSGVLYGGFKAFADKEQKEEQKNEKVVYKFKSKAEAEKIVGKLKAGKKYRIREVKAPDGYVKSEPVDFEVNKDGVEQEIKIVNDYTKVVISKKDASGEKELPGAKMKIVEINGEKEKTVEQWTTTDTPKTFNKLKVGKYKLIEEQAPDGYVVANEVEFDVKEIAEEQKVEMKDDTTKVKVVKVGKDNPEKQLEGCEFDIIEVEENND